MLRYAILNPYWNVPVDLAQKSVAPKILAGRTLASMRMEALSDWSATPQKLEPAAINWPAVASGATELRLRQLPGGDNAMGRVKFMFPNEFGIYLHDTPDKALLKLDDRHLSNGCIRLEDAARLGKWLFGGQAITMPKTPEQIAALPLPVPVYLTYLTTSGTDSGITLATDVYGLDGRVAPTALTSLRP
jgi:L,D-transpeptidase YcbB